MQDNVLFYKKVFGANKNERDPVKAHAIAVKAEVSIRWIFFDTHSRASHFAFAL